MAELRPKTIVARWLAVPRCDHLVQNVIVPVAELRLVDQLIEQLLPQIIEGLPARGGHPRVPPVNRCDISRDHSPRRRRHELVAVLKA